MALDILRSKVRTEFEDIKIVSPPATVKLDEHVAEVLFNRGVTFAHGKAAYDASLIQIRSREGVSNREYPEQIWCEESAIWVSGSDLTSLKEKLSEVLTSVTEWAEVKEIQKLLGEMSETADRIIEEIEVLSLRRVFSGRCRMCPT